MEAIQGHRFEVLYLVTLFTGLRRGEVCGLTWDCVDLDRGTIFINKQLQQVPGHSGEFRLTPTKNGKGRMITPAAFTLDVYGHVTEEMKRASADRIEKFIQGVSGT